MRCGLIGILRGIGTIESTTEEDYAFESKAKRGTAITIVYRDGGSGFAYIAVTPAQRRKTIWLGPVNDKDYNSAK